MATPVIRINTVEDAIQAFADAVDAPPTFALRWALSHWSDAAPRFLSLLTGYADGTDDSATTRDALFFIMHLFGDRGEQRAWPALCQVMLDEDRLIAVLGEEASVDTLKGVLIRCFDGDLTPLRGVIESTDAESITRGEALLAYAWLARDGRTSEAEFKEYLRHLLATAKPREEDYIWYNWIVVAAALGYQEFFADSVRLFNDGWVPPGWLTLEDFDELRKSADATGLNGLMSEAVAPFENVVESLADWPWGGDIPDEDDDEFSDSDSDIEPSGKPWINPLRHVGRNDPCPCGSGKKYKNCCLVAA
jgi:uncharacterized protein YchJ